MKSKKVISFERDAEFFFRLGIKYTEKRNYKKAEKYMEIAVAKEPFNVDYQFNLAGVKAEMGETEKSSEILKGILINIDPTLTECYFGIGCNYFDIEDFIRAKDYFEKYLHFDPEGVYADDVKDVLYYLSYYEGEGWNKKRLKTASKLVREGKRLYDRGEYEEAAEKLEAALEEDPGAVDTRNSLSMAFFMEGDVEKAISLANSTLKLDHNDVWAHCNLTMFYSSIGRTQDFKEQIKTLQSLRIGSKRELLKVLDTCVGLEQFSGIRKILKNYSGNRNEFLEALEETLEGRNISVEKKREIVSGISGKRRSADKV